MLISSDVFRPAGARLRGVAIFILNPKKRLIWEFGAEVLMKAPLIETCLVCFPPSDYQCWRDGKNGQHSSRGKEPMLVSHHLYHLLQGVSFVQLGDGGPVSFPLIGRLLVDLSI